MNEFLEESIFSLDNDEIMRLGQKSIEVGNVVNTFDDKVVQLPYEKLNFEYAFIGYLPKLERYEYEMYFL